MKAVIDDQKSSLYRLTPSDVYIINITTYHYERNRQISVENNNQRKVHTLTSTLKPNGTAIFPSTPHTPTVKPRHLADL